MRSDCSIPSSAIASVAIIGVEAGGRGAGLGENAAPLSYGRPGVLHGSYSMLLQDADGQIQETHSVSAGLDYPGVGRSTRCCSTCGRVHYEAASDEEALAAVRECCECEGILPAIESAHALAGARRWAQAHPGKRMLIGLSGRGDKDMPTLTQTLLAAPRARADAAARAHRRGNPRRRARRRAGAGGIPDRRLSAARAVSRASRRRCRSAPTWSRSACPSPIRWPMA